MLGFPAEEHRPRWGARPSKPLRRSKRLVGSTPTSSATRTPQTLENTEHSQRETCSPYAVSYFGNRHREGKIAHSPRRRRQKNLRARAIVVATPPADKVAVSRLAVFRGRCEPGGFATPHSRAHCDIRRADSRIAIGRDTSPGGFATPHSRADSPAVFRNRIPTLAHRRWQSAASTFALRHSHFGRPTFGNRHSKRPRCDSTMGRPKAARKDWHSKPRRCDSGRRDHNGRIGSVGQS